MRRAENVLPSNDRLIKSLKHDGSTGHMERRIADTKGLWLYVYPPGQKTFFSHYSMRIGGKQKKRKVRLGSYGVGGFSLAEAKRRAKTIASQVEHDQDPDLTQKRPRQLLPTWPWNT